jgi:hypothetical protein
MKTQLHALLALAMTMWFGGSARADDCTYKTSRNATIDASGISSIHIDAGAGFLKIHGRSGLEEVSVMGTACASNLAMIAEIRLHAKREGTTISIKAELPDGEQWSKDSARLDLEIEVPESIPLRVTDSSGPIDIRSVAALDLQNGAGPMKVKSVQGDVTLKDGSGSIDVRDVAGSIKVVEDDAGGVKALKVEGSVLIKQSGSGKISVRDVGGDFTVESDGSGGISYRNVKGRVSLPDDK